MDVNGWLLIATVLGVLLYLALPVALALVFLARVNAALRRRQPSGEAARRTDAGAE